MHSKYKMQEKLSDTHIFLFENTLLFSDLLLPGPPSSLIMCVVSPVPNSAHLTLSTFPTGFQINVFCIRAL